MKEPKQHVSRHHDAVFTPHGVLAGASEAHFEIGFPNHE